MSDFIAASYHVTDGTKAKQSQINSALTAIQAAIDAGLIKGDATAGRKLRMSRLLISDGTGASTIKCELLDVWNGDTIASTDNVAKNATTGNFTLNAGGTQLKIEAAGLSGNAVAVLAASLLRATTTTLGYGAKRVWPSVGSNDILLDFSESTTGLDVTTYISTGSMSLLLVYITAA